MQNWNYYFSLVYLTRSIPYQLEFMFLSFVRLSSIESFTSSNLFVYGNKYTELKFETSVTSSVGVPLSLTLAGEE